MKYRLKDEIWTTCNNSISMYSRKMVRYMKWCEINNLDVAGSFCVFVDLTDEQYTDFKLRFL